MPDAVTFDAATKFITASGVVGMFVVILVALFQRRWMPVWLHQEIVQRLEEQNKFMHVLLDQSERDAQRWQNVVISGHGVLKEAVAAAAHKDNNARNGP